MQGMDKERRNGNQNFSLKSSVQRRIHDFKFCMNDRPKSGFKDIEAANCLSSLYEKCVVSADKDSNNIFVCRAHYYECLIKELGIKDHLGNPTYIFSTYNKDLNPS